MPMQLTLARRALLGLTLAAFGPVLSSQCGIDTNYGANLMLADDAVSSQLPLGFAFPFAGGSYDAVYVCSNGFLYLFDTNGSVPPPTDARCCTGNPGLLLASTSPMVCAFWTDLNPAASGAGVYFNATGGRAFATWVNTPEFGGLGTSNTFQITLYPTGEIELHHDSNCINYSPTLAGWSPGNGAANPGSRDLSAVPFTAASATVYEQFQANTIDLAGRATRGSAPSASSWSVDAPTGCAMAFGYGASCRASPLPRLSARPGSRPVLNTTFQLSVQNVPAATASGVLFIGVTNPNLNLAVLGLPGSCVVVASQEITLSFPTTVPTTLVPIPIPNNATLTGRALNTQAILLVPTLPVLPIALSNGVRMVFGL